MMRTSDPPHQARPHAVLALRALLLAVNGLLDAAPGVRIFPRYLAKGGTGGFLFLQRRQRLAKPQQCIRGLRRAVELGCHAEKGFSRLAILLTLEEALAEPELCLRHQRIARIFALEVAHGFFGER